MAKSREEEVVAWFDQYHQTIFKFIVLIVKDYFQAEDLTQETFVKAYQYYPSFKRNASPKTWLFSIAHNVTVDYLRKSKPIRLFREVFSSSKKDPEMLPEEILEVKESSRELYDVLNKMKESHRKVLVLRKIKGFSIVETAQILNWSESKVKATTFRAMGVLEKELKKEDFYHEQTRKKHL
ncbi:RNA polymerase sigma factor [Sutcliffiella halmapala]|uniref:RNA polymerase sigma factor n=1 Tax=Sutcliffiella halmapala TaxID=79882 RepID=UPI000994E209|nr:sigma-70 family RNA polymerase sigma factor [Sutcliffiella halmapala]